MHGSYTNCNYTKNVHFYKLMNTYNRRERDQRGDLGVDGLLILGWISRRWDGVYGLDWAGPG